MTKVILPRVWECVEPHTDGLESAVFSQAVCGCASSLILYE